MLSLLLALILSASSTAKQFLMPPGCTCTKPGLANDQNCDQFDCPQPQSTSMNAFSPPPITKLCAEKSTPFESLRVESFNLRVPYKVVEDQLNDLICIAKDNSHVKGVYLEDQGYPPAKTIFSPGSRVAKPRSFHSNSDTINRATHDTFQLDKIAALYPSSIGYLSLPKAGDNGNCIDLNSAQFGIDQIGSCYRSVEDLATDCEGVFNVDYFVPSHVQAEKGSVILGEHSSSTSKGGVQVNISNKERASWDVSSSICTNALKSLHYEVLINQTSILEVSVVMKTADISAETGFFEQHFSIQFMEAEVDSISSGNPGYIKGMPTLGAIASTANETLVAQSSGFAVLDTGKGGQCNSSSVTGTTVGFAKDVFVGCTQSMTRDELEQFCTSDVHPMLLGQKIGDDTFVYPKWLESSQDFLGIFGNADPLDRQQWIEIESPMKDPSFSVKRRNWIAHTNECKMPATLKIEILWTHVGNVQNPQAKILSAKRTYSEATLQHKLMPNEKQPYSFSATVSWTYASPPKKDILKSLPPTLIFSVPHDVFYPFLMNSGSKIHYCCGWQILIFSMILFWIWT